MKATVAQPESKHETIVPLSGPPMKVGGSVTPPRMISMVAPRYSREARKAHIEGIVLVSAVIDIDGRAKEVKVIRSLGSDLDEEAVKAVRASRFEPGRKDGQPVPIVIKIEENFRLY